MKDYLYFDSHVHVRPDEKPYDFIDISFLEESLKESNLDGCIATIHSTKEDYKKDFSSIKKYCKRHSNIIPGVEITQPYAFNSTEVNCHIMYMGDIPCEDIEFGSWFCHVEKKGGLFFQYNRNNLCINPLLKSGQINIVESTTDCDEVIHLKSLNLTVLLGTDIHPKSSRKYSSYLGSKGTMIKAPKFNYWSFMDALKNNSFGYFTRTEQQYSYILP